MYGIGIALSGSTPFDMLTVFAGYDEQMGGNIVLPVVLPVFRCQTLAETGAGLRCLELVAAHTGDLGVWTMRLPDDCFGMLGDILLIGVAGLTEGTARCHSVLAHLMLEGSGAMGIMAGGAAENLAAVTVLGRTDEVQILLVVRLGMGFPHVAGGCILAGGMVDQVVVTADVRRQHLVVLVDLLVVVQEALRS